MDKMLRPCIGVFVMLTLVTGVAYPLVVTGIAWLTFPSQAGGSVIERDGRAVGSELIGQPFSRPGYFSGRPSATGSQPYNGAASAGSNLATTNPVLAEAVAARVAVLRAADAGNMDAVPVDLVTASASGLDPHISPAAAEYQVARIARTRELAPELVRELVAAHTHGRAAGVLGEPRVSVLELNLALDAAQSRDRRQTP
jgi:K+-transporting ATPase ATPase C chain